MPPLSERVELALIEHPTDPRLADVAGVLSDTFPDPDVVLGLDRLQSFLRGDDREPRRAFFVLAATAGSALVGCSVFSYVPASQCGFSEYIATAAAARGQGIGRRLFEVRHEVLDRAARRSGAAACAGLFVEAESPERTPPRVLTAERDTAMDAAERRAYFRRLGFLRVDVAYSQPPLGDGKQPVDYLDLLFLPWADGIARSRRLPRPQLTVTLQAIWCRWAPASCREHLDRLSRKLPEANIPLLVE